MFKKIILALALASAAFAQEAPTANPSEVWVKGRKVDHSWRDGRIWVPASQLQPLLNISDPMPSLDLLKALEQKGGYIWTVANGKFEAKPDPSRYSQTGPSSSAVKRSQSRVQNAERERPTKSTKGVGLKYQVEEFETEWGYKWARVKVTNVGRGVSDICTAYCHFQDSFGITYAEDWWPVGQLQPGESTVFEITSGKDMRDTPITPSAENVMVYFFSEQDSRKNPKSMREAQSQAKSNKKRGGLKGPTLDFSRNAPHQTTGPSSQPSSPMGSPKGW